MEDIKTCTRCKHSKDISEFRSYNNRITKTCQTCRDYANRNIKKNLCEHSRIRSQCKDCNGSNICQHSRIRSQCKDCNGSNICQHSRIRSRCKECNGGSICDTF